jgi:5-methylcytosine-specific restriction protein A
MTKAQYSGPWKRIRRQVLERDGHLCQIQAAGCTSRATQVDHIVPVAKNGEWWNPDNLRAACGSCNNGRNATSTLKASRIW